MNNRIFLCLLSLCAGYCEAKGGSNLQHPVMWLQSPLVHCRAVRAHQLSDTSLAGNLVI